ADAEASAGGPSVDLPAGIGKPATRALLGAGLATPEQVARRTQAELLALHGVGPKAVRILAEALQERGLAFRG
ncbi:helix-hairpin-helix domain-containing protein, partial [Streptomyces sp. NPDC059861]|uniref:helix-hairpin-helix domain-containing protein n=1 Tax=Streptomyces sp. NPDC059861 TaxID=3346974 RepID=UPI00364710F1